MKILFVGNSHTFNEEVPYRVQKLAAAETGVILSPVAKAWWDFADTHPAEHFHNS